MRSAEPSELSESSAPRVVVHHPCRRCGALRPWSSLDGERACLDARSCDAELELKRAYADKQVALLGLSTC